MKDEQDYRKDIASIRTMMERSSKFISLSGLSGLLAGVYALMGAAAAYYLVHYPASPFEVPINSAAHPAIIGKLLLIASVVLVASVSTGLLLSYRKAKRAHVTFWNSASRQLSLNLAFPLVSGGLFILILLYTGHYGIAAPACLLFYGLALIQASSNTFDEVRYLGFTEIALGLISALLPGYGLLFWALGFGVMHIVYGAVMHFRYDQ